MKKLRWLFALLPMLLFAAPAPQNLTFAWDYPDAPSTNIVFLLYYSANSSAPRPWTLIKTVPGTVLTTTLIVTPGQAFYYMTASNIWWKLESDPSNVAGTPAFSSSGGTLSIQRGP